eukprot:SAG31_NODE_10099_length_1182_cov_3.018467_2_plen_102_part_01
MAVAALWPCTMLCCPPLLLLAAAAAAQSLPPAAAAAPGDHKWPTAAAHVVRSATTLCGGGALSVAASLQAVGIGDDRTVATAELLAKHGFQTALDLRLLRAG